MRGSEISLGGERTDPTTEMLSEMYRNVTMGSESLAAVVPKIRGRELMTNVTAQLEQYADFTGKTARMLRKRAVKPKDPSLLKKTMTRGGIALNLLFDSSDGNIAQMIKRGTQLGAEQLEDKLEEYERKGCEREAADLCRDILAFEDRQITEADNMAR